MTSPTRMLPFAAILLVPAISAQGESRGIFPGVPAALSVDGSGLDRGQLYLKSGGFQQNTPVTWPNVPGPSFDLGALLQQFGATTLPDVDALSIGEDWVLADCGGHVDVPNNRWAAITFSVSRGTAGAPGSRIESEAITGNGASADVFSYVLPGSTLPPEFVDQVERAHDSREIDLGAGQKDIDALDHFIPIYTLESGMRQMMPVCSRIFFSVTTATLNDVPGSWWNGTTPSGATILELSCSSTGGYLPPQPYMTAVQLGLRTSEDIDALAIDLLNQRILLSTKTPSRDEILFLGLGCDQLAIDPYRDQQGIPVSTRIGLLQVDDVDAICAMDPSIRARGARPNPFYYFAGTPRPPALGMTPAIGGSAFRGFDGVDTVFQSFMVGWPPNTGQGPGLAALVLTFDNSTMPVFGVSPILVRNDLLPVFGGDPQTWGLRVPPQFSLTAPPIEVTLRWFAFAGGGLELAEAWPVLVRI